MKNRTIVAISTPIGVGGIGIVRMSGERALSFACKICSNTKFKDKPREMILTDVKTEKFTEKALVVYFKAPNSYTGEDMIEFQCHGGIAILNGVVKELLSLGASLAENGEFTKLAFLNGKMSLDAAEGVIDMINAESDAEIRAGFDLISNKLKNKIKEIQDLITDCFAQIEVALDYPEHDIEYATSQDILIKLEDCKTKLNNLINTVYTGNIIKHGIDIAIVGNANVGKSTLFNSLTNKDKAIVTDIAGTTRDILNESITYNGVKYNFIDTAGIRETEDLIEKIGIERAEQVLINADIVLIIADLENFKMLENIKIIKNKKCILVFNKIDKFDDNKINILSNKIINEFKKLNINFEKTIFISALKNTNIKELKQLIFDLIIDKNIYNNSTIITSSRQADALKNAQISIENAISGINNEIGLDLVNIDLVDAWQFVGEVTGDTNADDRINSIFDKFCLGK